MVMASVDGTDSGARTQSFQDGYAASTSRLSTVAEPVSVIPYEGRAIGAPYMTSANGKSPVDYQHDLLNMGPKTGASPDTIRERTLHAYPYLRF